MKSLQQLWDEHDGRLIDRWAHYLPVYERYFSRFRGTACNILEIGVAHGGSLQLWKAFFGPKAWIRGLDIDPRCREYEEEQITILIGDQGSADYWDSWGAAEKGFDVIIDDGSHLLADQQLSLDKLWPRLRVGGVYLIEDIHGMRLLPVRREDMGHISHEGYYPWMMVLEKQLQPGIRIVTGRPSRPLNPDELAAYGAIDAKYRDPNA